MALFEKILFFPAAKLGFRLLAAVPLGTSRALASSEMFISGKQLLGSSQREEGVGRQT